MLYIAYEYESALGAKVRKLVLCKNEKEYHKMKEKIDDAGLEPIEFVCVYNASNVLKGE